MSKRSRMSYLRAELSELEAAIRDQWQNDPLGRLSAESLKVRVLSEIALLEEEIENTASVDLFFFGDPVYDTQGVDARFATEAISRYQDIVSTSFAQMLQGSLGERGPIPLLEHSKLFITDVVRGSFGFCLEEVTYDEPPLIPSFLAPAITKANAVIVMMARGGERIEDIFEEVDYRTFSAARSLFEHMSKTNAGMRIEERRSQIQITQQQFARAFESIKDAILSEEEVNLTGRIIGVTPISRRFELRPTGQDMLIRGRFGSNLAANYLEQIDRGDFNLGALYAAKLTKKTVTKPGGDPVVSYTMLAFNAV